MSLKAIPIGRPELQSLFRAVGGEEGLRKILEDFYTRMASDVMIGFFFNGKDLNIIAGKQREFLMRAMGAAESYSGKAPAQAHTELAPILPGHFDRRLKILEETLQAHAIDAAQIRVWIAFESTFRGGIVK